MTDFTELVDLAKESLGGSVLWANDDFFAAKENLLKDAAAEWREHDYTDRGKWMDGWETRRRREPGFDSCVVRLGLPGVIRGVVVDTSYFRGNYPAECSLEGAVIEPANHDLDAIHAANWTALLQRSALQGNEKNRFAIGSPQRFTHLRLHLYPDGGVARLRVHGEVRPDWKRLVASGGLLDLASLEHGGVSLVCSDMFFGARNNLLLPGRPHDMSSGWETRRRRGPGHDWNLVRLGALGLIRRIEVDTSHFKGNAPGWVSIEACETEALDRARWTTLLPETRTQPHTRHLFEDELRCVGRVNHVRLNVFPDGGVARLRVFAEPLVPDARAGAIARLNSSAPAEAHAVALAACGSARFAAELVAARPFEDAPALLRLAERIYWTLGEADLLEAFAAHPHIGAREAAPGQHGDWSRQEQAQVASAGAETLGSLAEQNRAYLARHGFVFLVSAAGKSAAELSALLDERLTRSRSEELRTAAEEQAKILRLRLERWLDS